MFLATTVNRLYHRSATMKLTHKATEDILAKTTERLKRVMTEEKTRD